MKGRYTMKTEDTKNTRNRKPMSEAAREARNAYKREWAKKNPDKVKAATRRYWERKAQEAEALEG